MWLEIRKSHQACLIGIFVFKTPILKGLNVAFAVPEEEGTPKVIPLPPLRAKFNFRQEIGLFHLKKYDGKYFPKCIKNRKSHQRFGTLLSVVELEAKFRNYTFTHLHSTTWPII